MTQASSPPIGGGAQHPSAHAIEPIRVRPAGLGSDPLAADQWHLLAPPAEVAGTGLQAALNTPRLLESIVVAVVDTGVLSTHSDMGTVLPGFDFVSDTATANDGDGRDPDPTDPGDWVTQDDIDSGTLAEGCSTTNSTWHGTTVAGMLSANTGNALGIASAAPPVKILPVRVMGRCGGTVVDLIDGIRWAAGLAVQGVDANPHPALVINLSLGYTASCSDAMQDTLDEVRQAGAVVVTAIGNGGHLLSEHPYSPASCDGVITVAASDRSGNYAYYNNHGHAVDILAPGGTPGAGLMTLDDGGSQNALHDDSYYPRYGSSIATPLVSATAALMVASNPLLLPRHIEELMLNNTREVGDTTLCPEDSCGAGLLDARLAVHAAANTDLPTSGGGGAIHPLLLLLLILLQRGVAKVSQLMQYRSGKLPRWQHKAQR